MQLTIFLNIPSGGIDYGLVHKNIVSDNEIKLTFFIRNKSNESIEEGTVYKIKVNQYDGEFVLAKELEPGRRGKGYILIFGNTKEQRYSDILNTEINRINFSMKTK